MEKKIGFWGRLNVRAKLGAIAVLFIAAISGVIAYTVNQQRGAEANELVMEVVGRQRMLVQLFFRDILLASQGLASEHSYWSKVYKESQDGLLDGGEVTFALKKEGKVFLSPAPNQEIREKLLEARGLFSEIDKAGEEILRLKRDHPDYPAKVRQMAELSLSLQDVAVSKAYLRHFQRQTERMIQNQIAVAAVAGLIGLFLTWLISGGITGPLAQVVERARKISQGDLRAEMLPVASSDEIGNLAEVFNSMQETLKELARQTHEGTLNLNSASQEILASAQQQAASAKEQAAAVHQTTSTVEEVRHAGSQISERARQVAQAAEATASAGRTGLKSVQEAAQSMDKIREQVEAVAENVVTLSEKAQAVGEIISSVNDIAEQSHLLALNAAIEAAAAGEAGKSFSVVAGEIKSLADQAKEATVQVRNILSEIQKGITRSVMLTEEAVKRVETGKKQAEVSEKTIRELAETTTESVQAFQQTIATTNQQQIGYDQVNSALQDIRKASEQTAAGTSQLEKAVANLGSLSQQLRKTVERYQL